MGFLRDGPFSRRKDVNECSYRTRLTVDSGDMLCLAYYRNKLSARTTATTTRSAPLETNYVVATLDREGRVMLLLLPELPARSNE